jgi:hypothetical protein
MAFFARYCRVQADQRKSRKVMVEVDLLSPTRFLVALLAIASQLALVRVIVAMAGDARHGELIAVEVAGMALLALQLGVTSPQRKLGGLVVVEANGRPLLRDMAGLTLRAKKACVLVLQLVTGDARRGQIFVPLTHMALCAGYLVVRANQRKPGLGVIEGLYATPGFLAMTVIAFFPQLALVRIVRLVTVETPTGRLAVFLSLCMATIAACALVRPRKDKVGEGMIEGLAVELNNVNCAPLVVGMTRIACSLRRFGVAAMEAAHLLPIHGDRLVARQAEARLQFPRKRHVTAVAGLFQVRMSSDERS